MGAKTEIQWTEATWNPCYPTWTGDVRFIEEHLRDPLKWKEPRRIFVNSMSDLFHESLTVEQVAAIFQVMHACPHHTFQVLTKRPKRMAEFCTALLISGPPNGILWPFPNVWLGVSCEDQKTADERIPLLLQTPAAVRWISAEPLLGPIDVEDHLGDDFTGDLLNGPCERHPGLDWLVVGGESGPGARPMHPDWARSLRDQCQAAEVPFFFKQWGEWASHEPLAGGDLGGEVRNGIVDIVQRDRKPDGHFKRGDVWMKRIGKKAAGRLLDGREWNEYPEVKR